jgi:hypothetical protein
MKIRMDTQGAVSVLIVNESVGAQEIDVLRAGVSKLLVQGKSPLILDLVTAELKPDGKARLPELLSATSESALLLIASPDAEIAAAPTVSGCLELLASPAAKLLAEEGRLKTLISLARARKARAERQLSETEPLAMEIRMLRRENGAIRATMLSMEEQVREQLKTRKAPWTAATYLDQTLNVVETLRDVFAPTELVKIGAGT